jgi:HlyD family secretion protein
MKLPKSIWFAVIGVLLTGFYLWSHAFRVPAQKPTRPLAKQPYSKGFAGLGLVEPLEKAVRVMPYYSGRVETVFVQEGDAVKPGSPLYALNTQALQAAMAKQQAVIAQQQATLHRLQQEPRPERLPALTARVENAKSLWLKEKALATRYNALKGTDAVSANDVQRQQLSVQAAYASWQEALATLKLEQAGTWQAQQEEARQAINVAKADLNTLRVQLQQATVRSAIEGTVLQVNLRAGEYVAATPPGDTLGSRQDSGILLGSLEQLQVKVDLDEVTAAYVKPGLPATGYIKGNASLKFPLRFVRVYPFMVPKRNLNGNSGERVDVRVLQVIYAFDPPKTFTVYPGQQVEVYLKDEAPALKTPRTPLATS